MTLETGKRLADQIVEQLREYCDRIEIAGSIRRKAPNVNDIEIVCIPKQYNGYACAAFCQVVMQWSKVKGEPTGKYTQRMYSIPESLQTDTNYVKVDIFMPPKDSWGYIFAIRTGSEAYSHKVLANSWVKKGYRGKDGYLTQDGIAIPILEERDLFDLIGVAYLPPELRNMH